MVNVANDASPDDVVVPEPPPALTVASMLALPAFRGARLLAGAAGTQRPVRRANVMEVPDIVAWVRPEGVLLTTGYPLRETTTGLADLVAQLDDHGVSALAVKLHRYLDALPEDMLAEAERRGFPVIVLPDSAGFDELLTEVFTSVASERASLLERSEEVHRQLVDIVLTGGSVHDVTASVGALFHGAAVVTSADGRVVSEGGAPDALADVHTSALFHESGRFRTEVATEGLHPVGERPDRLAVVRIRAGRIDHGRLAVFCDERALTRADLTILERAATVAAVALTKDIAVHAVESKYRGDFLRDLLSGRAGRPEDVVGHAAALGWDLDRPMVVTVAVLETHQGPELTLGYQGPAEVERFAAAWRSVVGRRHPGAPVEGFAAEVVCVLPVGSRAEAEAAAEGAGGPAPSEGQADVRVDVRVDVRADVRAEVAALLDAVVGDGGGGRRPFATGVSRTVESVAGLPAAYEQARKALHVGRQMHGPQALVHFDDLGVFRLLSLIEDGAELSAFVEETLGDLAAETPEAADLRATLQMLLDTNLNVAETARRLHFHYNTLRYRIGKLERVVGPFTSDANLRLDLALALRVVSMRQI